jgi:hypothetical protein
VTASVLNDSFNLTVIDAPAGVGLLYGQLKAVTPAGTQPGGSCRQTTEKADPDWFGIFTAGLKQQTGCQEYGKDKSTHSNLNFRPYREIISFSWPLQ